MTVTGNISIHKSKIQTLAFKSSQGNPQDFFHSILHESKFPWEKVNTEPLCTIISSSYLVVLKQGELPLSQLLAFVVGNIFLKFWHHMNAQQAQSHKAASMGLDPTLFCFVLLEKKNISRPHQSTTAWTCRLRDSLSWNWWGRMMLWQRCVTVSVL